MQRISKLIKMYLHGISLLKEFEDEMAYKIIHNCLRGIEKENLRVTQEGTIAKTTHPISAGSSLTHDHITTDFSEALIELVTKPFKNIRSLRKNLYLLNSEIWRILENNEWLWPTSMPPYIHNEKNISIANYGKSYIGKMKHIYRVGLSNRYGRIMQIIAGIHFNFSFPKILWENWKKIINSKKNIRIFQSERYMQLIRNFYKEYWIFPYLFGASPSCMKSSILGNIPKYLVNIGNSTFISQYATSLRLSDLGYQNNFQSTLKISYNNIDSYSMNLLNATQKIHPIFSNIGVKVNSKYKQLNASILQIENEFYSPIRPKSIFQSGKMPSLLLKEKGVEYIEIRIFDLNPFEKLGISYSQIIFIEIFLWYCVVKKNEFMSDIEYKKAEYHYTQVVLQGRNPKLYFSIDNLKKISFQERANKLFEKLYQIAIWLDKYGKTKKYVSAMNEQYKIINNISLTPSQRLLLNIEKLGFMEANSKLAKKQKKFFQFYTVSNIEKIFFENLKKKSLQKKKELESKIQKYSFDEYLYNYFQQGKKYKI